MIITTLRRFGYAINLITEILSFVDMFCDAKRDIFDDIKNDVHSLRSHAICCPKATRCDTNPRLRSKHIVCKTHIASQREISQIPQGIYIAKQKICFPKKADFVVLLGISP